MHVLILASVGGSFCAAQPGEPLRGTTEACEQGRTRAYAIGAVSHRAADLALVVDLPVTRPQVEAATRASFGQAFPGWGRDPELVEEVESETGWLLDLVSSLPVGSTVRMTPGQYLLTTPTREGLALARTLAPVALAHLRELAARA